MNGDRSTVAALLSSILALRSDVGAGGDAPQLSAAQPLAPQLLVFPPYPYLTQAAELLAGSGIEVGAQDVSVHDEGAYTGEVSARMLADVGCRWALSGHSERRTLFAEDDATVAAKGAKALGAGLGLIACVGETLEEREADRTEAVLARQVDALGALAAAANANTEHFVVAYEPVWAIGTGRTATPEQAQAAHAFIRARLERAGFAQAGAIRLLYGGSVKPANAESLFSMPDIDGGLIGGASLSALDFVAIAAAARAPAAQGENGTN